MKITQKSLDRASSYFCVILFLVMLTLISLWTIDISVSSMLIEGTGLTNGFFISSPAKLYHVGLYTISVAIAILGFICGYLALKNFQYKILLEKK